MANRTEKDIDMSWAARGACRNQDPDLFYSDYLSAPGRIRQQAALQICQRCEVRAECLDYALIYERHGVWGGMTESQRSAFRRAQNLETKLDRYNLQYFLPRKQARDKTLGPKTETASNDNHSADQS